ncbi:DNA gyrase subunit A [bacterium endosymbiont of Pedicinus badii]|uniref:DNA gyrase subunit A n=1 Tax=bacterium endosymbiont of Pedicinus badii TaxID=1719126 RepID=UPI0009BA198C|nr:DNA gyrase subunit A [bacterium endosymbiont of Pedicinus badii]OQM34441.1 DNA gyrase subunit A [bacterium endosymbiont of Pedicinus badii]
MSDFAKEITLVNIEKELKKSYLNYAMSVIIGRALPDARDGLKPVHRRILYAMYTIKNFWNRPYKKSARIVGDVIGKYHPHGDSAVYETIVRMAQNFSLRYTLIDGQGNFGSIDGDSAAAMRYTEVRMTKIAQEMLSDIEKNTVNFSLNYDESEKIPEIFPNKIPNLLINGSSGIAVGMATNIPPHNITEVIDACLAYIEDENISTKKIMKYIKGPDFPTAAIINGKIGIKTAYKTGKGKIIIRAKAKIEKKKNGREKIIISQIPYQVNKSNLLEKISFLVKEKKIEGISNFRDESDREGMRIVIETKKGFIGKIVLNNLYSMTQLQTSFGINMVALHKGKPKLLSLKKILSIFLEHRKEVVYRKTIFELKKEKKKLHTLQGIIIAVLNLEKIISIIKNSSNVQEAKKNLKEIFILHQSLKNKKYKNIREFKNKEKYYFSKKQIEEILNLKLQKLTNLEINKVFQEYEKTEKYIKNLTKIKENSNTLVKVIKKELVKIRNEYKDFRKTKIIENSSSICIEDLINKKNVVITLSYHGYVKYQPLKDYQAQHRGGKGKFATKIKEKDFIDCLLIANTHDKILLFSSQGKIYWMHVYQLPEAKRGSKGKPIVNILPLQEKERITAILSIKKYNFSNYVVMATSKGIIKKTSLNSFSRPREKGIIAINLDKNDQLIGVDITDGNKEIMLFSSKGKVVRFQEKQVRSTGRNARGVIGINLSKEDKVVSLIIPKQKGDILTVTQNGYGKRTKTEEYPVKSRATQGVVSIKTDLRNGKVVKAVQVDSNDQVMIITNSGKIVRIRVSEVSLIKRNTKGVLLIRKNKKEKVVDLQRTID